MFNEFIKTLNWMTPDQKVNRIGTVNVAVIMAANAFILIAIGISIATIALSFILFTTSSGDKKAVDKAKKSLMWSIIGFVAALSVFAIKGMILRMLGTTYVE